MNISKQKSLKVFKVVFNYRTGLEKGTTTIYNTIICATNNEAMEYTRSTIKVVNDRNFPNICGFSCFKKEIIDITEGILYDSLLQTHPEYFV